ncbi:MAG: DNA recombination protein RmuC [Candidatus Margulisbacteria bacterium]|nr:DNA recombination protein RmuC [Candidatus Margulisiibacteriota bacterium]
MEIMAIVLSLASLFALGFLFVKINQLASIKGQDTSDQLKKEISEQLSGIRGEVSKLYADNQTILQKVNTDLTQTLQTVDKNVNYRLDNAAKVIGDVHRKLGEVHETTKQVQEISKDISSLQEILRAPKLRGGLGELFLGDLLRQVLPPANYQEQYRFKSGEKVDAVILLNSAMVPIDSKFPLENFKRVVEAKEENSRLAAKKQFVRDVKKHIDAIRQKYILPDEGTFDFALMYIMAENVYYEIIIKDEDLDDEKSLFKYAIDNKVIPVSPNSFYGYLQTILLGLRGMRIEEQAQEILKNLTRLEGDFERVMGDFIVMGNHLKNTFSKYEEAEKRLTKFGDKLGSLEQKSGPEKLLDAHHRD